MRLTRLLSGQNVWNSPTLRQQPLESTELKTWIETLVDCLAMEGNMIGTDVSGSGGDGTTGECMELRALHLFRLH